MPTVIVRATHAIVISFKSILKMNPRSQKRTRKLSFVCDIAHSLAWPISLNSRMFSFLGHFFGNRLFYFKLLEKEK